MTGLVHDEKRIGCMSGFLQIFDRQRVHSTKRLLTSNDGFNSSKINVQGPPLLPSTDVGASPEIVSSVKSSSENNAKIESKSTFELRDGTKKYSGRTLKEIPRLSLDSRGSFDSKGSLRTNSKDVSLKNSVVSATTESAVSVVAHGDDKHPRSPSVIAKLMGLESLSSPNEKKDSISVARKPALQRSSSESRVKYIDNNNFQVKKPSQVQKQTEEIVVKDKHIVRSIKSESSKANSWRSRTVFDSNDFYPMSIEEQKNDLGTLKQILEVLQLKGLLHSTRPGHRNFVYDRNVPSEGSNIVVVKPCRSPVSKKVDNRSGRTSPVRGRSSSTNRIESNLKSCNSIVKRKPLSVEIRQRANELSDARSSPVKSPKVTPKRNGSSGHSSARTRSQSSQKRTESFPVYSPNRKLMKNIVTDDESSSISESTISTPTTNESEISKCEVFQDGKTLLQRCDKLLENIAKMNNTVESPPSPCIVLPSPVSVLDLGYDDKDESLSPSHSIDFKATPSIEFEDDIWSHTMSPTKSTEHEEEFTSDNPDFIYISKILKSSHYLNEDSNAFLSIEKQLYDNTDDTTSLSKRHRKLVFDVIIEILDRYRQLPPWKMPVGDSGTSVKSIWFEYQKMQEVNTGDSLLDLISCVLRKDLLEVNGWGDYLIERSEMILDIERMVFKDLVSEAICDFDEFSSRFMFSKAQRKLVF